MKIVTIISPKNFSWREFNFDVKAGANVFEIDEQQAKKLEEIKLKSKWIKRESEKKGGISFLISDEPQDQKEIDEKFEEVKQVMEQDSKHKDLASLDLKSLKDLYKDLTGSSAGNIGLIKLREKIIEIRETSLEGEGGE